MATPKRVTLPPTPPTQKTTTPAPAPAPAQAPQPAPEPVQAKAPEPKKVDPTGPVTAPAKKQEDVTRVRPKGAYGIYVHRQKTTAYPGIWTLVRRDRWIETQLEAGILEEEPS
jgi:outer membrane biosynthesis protein TonB